MPGLRHVARAVFALLRLDFGAALRCHPMIYVLPPVVLRVVRKAAARLETRERVLLWDLGAVGLCGSCG